MPHKFVKIYSIRSFSRGALLSFLLLGSSSCSDKRICEPVWDIPSNAINAETSQAYFSDFFEVGPWPNLAWWKDFHDPQLECLILAGLAANPDVDTYDAMARLAAAQANVVGASLFPHLSLESDALRFRQSETGIFGVFPPGTFPLSYTQGETLFNFSYEIDWWGKNRAALFSAIGEFRARQVEACAVRITLGLQIAEAYFRYQTAQQRLRLAERLVKNREENVKLIGLRVKGNLSSSLDLNNAKADLYKAQENVNSVKQDAEIYAHQVKALVAGQFDEEIASVDPLLYKDASFTLPSDIPLDLISHRADITAQILRTNAAMQDVYVAKAEFYPNLNLLAFAGFQTIHLQDWFKSESKFGFGGPAIHLPIFAGGALKANLTAKKEQYTIDVLEYEHLLISAVHDVLDGITNVKQWGKRFSDLTQAEEATKDNYALYVDRMNKSLSSKIEVLETEKKWLETKDSSTQALGAGTLARLSLIKALGGGFDSEI